MIATLTPTWGETWCALCTDRAVEAVTAISPASQPDLYIASCHDHRRQAMAMAESIEEVA